MDIMKDFGTKFGHWYMNRYKKIPEKVQKKTSMELIGKTSIEDKKARYYFIEKELPHLKESEIEKIFKKLWFLKGPIDEDIVYEKFSGIVKSFS